MNKMGGFLMKKTFLVLVLIATVLFSAAAINGFHYGIESRIGYEFNVTKEPALAGENKAVFSFSPYVKSDVFTLMLLAEWRPDSNNSHGFDYLLEFDTKDVFTTINSTLKYLDLFSLKTGVLNLTVQRGEIDTPILTHFNHKIPTWHERHIAEATVDVGILKVYAAATNFEPVDDKYRSAQMADVVLNLGAIEVEAEMIRDANSPYALPGSEILEKVAQRYIAKAGLKIKAPAISFGTYFTTDTALNEVGQSHADLFKYWVLEAVAGLKAGPIDVEATFFLDNQMYGYRGIDNDYAFFGLAAKGAVTLGEVVDLEVEGMFPFKLNDKLAIYEVEGVTQEVISAKVSFGKVIKVGASASMSGLVSDIRNKKAIWNIITDAKPTVTAGLYTPGLDVEVSGWFKEDVAEFVPVIKVVTTIRGDDFMADR